MCVRVCCTCMRGLHVCEAPVPLLRISLRMTTDSHRWGVSGSATVGPGTSLLSSVYIRLTLRTSLAIWQIRYGLGIPYYFLDAALAFPSISLMLPFPLSRISHLSGYGFAEGAGGYTPEVHPSGEVGCNLRSRDKWRHRQSGDSLSGIIHSVTVLQQSNYGVRKTAVQQSGHIRQCFIDGRSGYVTDALREALGKRREELG